MKLIHGLAIAALMTGVAHAAPALAQQAATVTIAPGNTLLTVSGEGRTLRAPDTALFSAGVTTQGASAGEALAANSRSMTQVIAALKRAGVAPADIQTSNLSINPIYADPTRDAMIAARASGQEYLPPPPDQQILRIIGYSANNTVSVRQRRLGDYGKIIDALAQAGANQINGPMFQMDKPEPALDEARRDAMRDARRKADLFAEAAGLRIVRAVSISESGGYFGPAPIVVTGSMAVGAPPPPPPAPVQPGELQMVSSVSVQYELGG